jgi:hypothetical protein
MKWCPRCQQWLAMDAFAVYASGRVATACRPCRRVYVAEYRARPEVRARNLAAARERHRVRMATDANYRAKKRRAGAEASRRRDPEERNEAARFQYWKNVGERPRAKAMFPSRQHYRRPTRVEVVTPEPLLDFIGARFDGWESYEIAAVAGEAVSERWLSRLLRERPAVVELDAVDRFLTLGLGRPDLLNDLYPIAV